MNLSRKWGQSFWMTGILLGMVLALLIQLNPIFSGTAQAEEAKIEIQTQVGFGTSNVKQGRETPAVITLRNAGGAVSGDLVIQIGNPNGAKDFSYAQHVELPQGSTKEIKLNLPSYPYTKGNNRISFYENSVQNGKKLTLDGNTYLEASNIPRDTIQVGVLARDADTLNFLALLNQSGKKVNVLHLKQTDIPETALGLDGLDVIVLNDFASDTLTQGQVQAIQGWTKRGGSLILAGGAGYPKTAAPFAEMAPVVYKSTLTVQDLPQLAKKGEKELLIPQPFTLSLAQLTTGAETFIAEGGIPVYAQKSYGTGSIIYAAYDLSLNPLASWNGNPKLWDQVLAVPLDRSNLNSMNQMRGNEPYWELNNALEYFPELQTPKLAVLAWVMLFYAIVVGPLLYFVLRRLDRREWAWVVIPVAAIVTSIGIFQFGATNRGNMMAQAFHTIEMDGSGSGVKHSLVSVFLPKGGQLDMEFPHLTEVRPFLQNDVYTMQQINEESELVIRSGQEKTQVRLQNIPYSSLSKMVIDEDSPVPIGNLAYKVTMSSGNSAKGEVTNSTKQDLEDAAVLINRSYIRIGTIKAGATAAFDSAAGWGISYAQDVANVAFPNSSSGGIDAGLHQRSLLDAYLFDKAKLTGGFEPMILGWMKDNTPLALASGKKLPAEQLTLVVQHMKMDYVATDGKIVLPSSLLVPEITDNHLKVSSFNFQNGPYMQMGEGEITFDYKLPAIVGAAYQKMNIQSEPNKDVNVEIWNAQSKAWETLDLKPNMDFEEEKLQTYLLEGNSIRMKASTLQNNTMFRIPGVSMEGRVKP
ncbi:hypothetical protein [Paenibacillus sp. SI8]|uniref:DUF7408 domain-containing protein n=1 Tax=unclassified Paenibacillus TaxID=185978 RepID=UPI0034675395